MLQMMTKTLMTNDSKEGVCWLVLRALHSLIPDYLWIKTHEARMITVKVPVQGMLLCPCGRA